MIKSFLHVHEEINVSASATLPFVALASQHICTASRHEIHLSEIDISSFWSISYWLNFVNIIRDNGRQFFNSRVWHFL